MELFNMPLSVTQFFTTEKEENKLLFGEWTTYYLGFSSYPELKFTAPCDSIPTETNTGSFDNIVDIEQTGYCFRKELGLGIRVTHARLFVEPDLEVSVDNYFGVLKQTTGINNLFYDKEYIPIINGAGMLATGSYQLYEMNQFKFNAYFIKKENKLWILLYECNKEELTEALFKRISSSIESSF